MKIHGEMPVVDSSPEEAQPNFGAEAAERHFEYVEARIDDILRLKKIVQDSAKLPPEEFNAALSAEVRSVAAKMEEIVGGDAMDAYVDAKRAISTMQGGRSSFVTLENILKNPRLKFLDRVVNWYRDMDSKRERVHEFEGMGDDAKNAAIVYMAGKMRDTSAAEQQLLETLDMDDLGVEFNGVHVDIFMSADNWKRCFLKDVSAYKGSGKHFAGSPLNCILERGNPGAAQETKEHEEMHNIFRSFGLPNIDGRQSVRQFQTFMPVAAEAIRKDPKSPGAEEYRDAIRDMFMNLKVSLDDELFADMSKIEKGEVPSTYYYYVVSQLDAVAQYVAKEFPKDIGVDAEGLFFMVKDAHLSRLRTLAALQFEAKKKGQLERLQAAIVLFEGDVRKVTRHMEHMMGISVAETLATAERNAKNKEVTEKQ